MKRKRFIALVLAFVFSVSSLVMPFIQVRPVHGAQIAQDFATKLVYAYCSLTGAVNSTLNGVGKVSGDVISALTTKVSELWGTGIYEDANGNIVWSGEASQEFYETLLGSNDINARAIGTFYGKTPYGGLYGLDSAFFNPDVRNFANSGRSYFTDYLCVVQYAVSSVTSTNPSVQSRVSFFDMSDVAYMILSADSNDYAKYQFFDSSGNAVSVDAYYMYGTYINSSFSSNSVATANRDSVQVSTTGYSTNATWWVNKNNSYFNNVGVTSLWPSTDSHLGYSLFPFYDSSFSSSLFWSNKTIIIGSNSAYGMQKYLQATGVIVNNEYNIMPSISRTDIENNNWTKIYNDYITNVKNEENTYITDNGVDPEALRKVIKKYTNVITDAIEEGTDDIEGAISYVNAWLEKIYERLGLIYNKMEELDSGGSGGSGSSCPWSDEDIDTILSGLDRIDSNLALELTEMQKIYTYLGTLLEAIEDIEAGGDGRNLVTIIPIITDLPDTDVLDFIDTGDILADLASSVVPFCFVAFVVGLADKLAAEPVTPSFSIPFKLNSEYTGVNIDESIEIDFSDYSDSGFDFIHGLVTAAWCISWIIMLVWLTFNLLESFNLIFG